MEHSALERMVRLARQGDQDAINELYEETRSYAYYIARQYLKNEADVQDVMQEVYSTVFEKLDTIVDGKSFAAWLYKIVSNKCLNIVKKKRFLFVSMDDIAEFAADSEEVLPAEWVENAEKRAEIMRLIHELPEGHRLAVLLHYIEGCPIAEVAEIMGITVEAVRNHLYHGRKAIKALVLEEEKKGNKLYALVPMPVLSKVFEMEAANATIPEAVSEAVWKGLIEKGVVKSTSAAPSTGANTANTASSPSGEGTNTLNANTHAANASANAAGAEAANKGGLIKMFLGLSTGKKIGVIAASLAVLTCLSLLASALAAPSPSSGLGDFVQVTPTPTPTGNGPNVAPPNPNGPGSGPGGGGQGPGQGGQGEPENPPQPPPKQGGKQGEQQDNTPIEVEVDPDIDADLKPKKGKTKEYEKQAVWTISFIGAKDSAPNKHVPDAFTEMYTLNFKAMKQGGESKYGAYAGEGYLQENVDTSGLMGQSQGVLVQMDMAWEGPLSGIQFMLDPPLEKLTPQKPLDDDLAPLVPETQADAKSKMTWESSLSQNYFETIPTEIGPIAGPMIDAQPPSELSYDLYAYANGQAQLNLKGTTATRTLIFWGTISKKVSWKQVK